MLFVSPCLTGGGMERVLLTLLRHLDRNQFVLHLAVLQAKGEFIDEVPDDVVLHDLRSPRLRYALPGLARLIWKVRPNVVVATLAYLNLGLILLRPFLPFGTRLLVREATVLSYNLRDEMRLPKLWEWIFGRLYKRADRVVCISDSVLQDFVENFGLPEEKLVRIYNPVDVQRVRECAARGGNPYDTPGPNLVAAGRLVPVKGFDVLLEAMAIVLVRLPLAHLTILGTGPLEGELEQYAQKLGIASRVRLVGFQHNPWRYFFHADAFVFTSRHESLGNVLLEALALETPVIATDCPGAVREIDALTPGMVIVPPENPQALAEAMITICMQPKPLREYPSAKFDLQPPLSQYSELLLS